ncbi:hypothetical protein [Ramlibacter humi]|uniref:Uncharacterized protein n=1 Tax=Ramlibacter humi TaxID=2530451 RepID=A0A4Z0CE92_9BURK|nr:hypothetical protein [Ramlibacter humi]TFZ08890.1 hypothetical protein EZ216_07040 [Ramlibacter humi]
MEDLKTALIAARQTWNTVKQSRAPEEAALNQYSGLAASFADITGRFDRWGKTLDGLSSMGKRRRESLAPEVAICRGQISQLKRCLDSHGNGLAWICANTSFLSLLNEIDISLNELRRFSEKEAVAVSAAAKEQFAEDVTVIQTAAEHARELRDQAAALKGLTADATAKAEEIEKKKVSVEKQTAELSEQIEAATTKTENDLEAFEQALASRKTELEELVEAQKEEVEELVSESRTSAENSKKSAEDASTVLAKIQKHLADAIAAREAAVKEHAQTQLELGESLLKLDQAKQALGDALKNVRRQGLSGAFFEKAEETAAQRAAEQKVFHSALLYLALIGLLGLFLEVYHGLPKDLSEWALRSARTLVLAAPGVWIAWMSARRLSALNRMVSDYEYKSATALAFESYRQEIESSGSKTLMDKLLDNAITTFGENPTRYYDSAKDEPVMPAESLLQKLGLKAQSPALPAPK